MKLVRNLNLNYERPIKIADDIYWIGYWDIGTGLHCNPYMIVDNDETVIIDSGSRPDFPTVMMKVLQTGIKPSSIKALIYHHYDPDLCGNIPDFEDIIDNPDLKIISAKPNHMFIKHYAVVSRVYSLEEINHQYEFKSGRKLKFITTPFAHSPGSTVTYDEKSGVLFTSDLFGSYSIDWDLFLALREDCYTCSDYNNCPNGEINCPLPGIIDFHKNTMPCKKTLKKAMDKIKIIPIKTLAPQHGSVVSDEKDIRHLINVLYNLENVGIDMENEIPS